MLIFTKPGLKDGAGRHFSRQGHRTNAARQALANLACVPDERAAGWRVARADSDADDESMQALLPMFQDAGALLVYLHGYNATPTAFFERCDRLHARFGLEVVRLSWSKNSPPDDMATPSPDGPFSLGPKRDFTRLCAAEPAHDASPGPAANAATSAAAAAAKDGLQGPSCSWWVLMALTGKPASAH